MTTLFIFNYILARRSCITIIMKLFLIINATRVEVNLCISALVRGISLSYYMDIQPRGLGTYHIECKEYFKDVS